MNENENTSKSRRPIMLRRLINCNAEQQARVREIRNQDSVRRSMYTDHIISSDEHSGWIEALKQDKKQLVFVVMNERQEAIGVVSINALDHLHRKSDWAFYLDERERGGLGAVLEYNLIEYAFGALKLEKLNCEVLETNESVVAMHKKFFFQEEGFRRSNIEKNGTRIGVVFLGLTKADWLANKEQVISAYRRLLEKYSIAIVDE